MSSIVFKWYFLKELLKSPDYTSIMIKVTIQFICGLYMIRKRNDCDVNVLKSVLCSFTGGNEIFTKHFDVRRQDDVLSYARTIQWDKQLQETDSAVPCIRWIASRKYLEENVEKIHMTFVRSPKKSIQFRAQHSSVHGPWWCTQRIISRAHDSDAARYLSRGQR